MLIQLSISGVDNEFNRPTVYVILVSWIILVAYWLRRLDVGLSLYPPLFIIPVMQVFFIFFALLCGGIYFQEFNGFTTAMFAGFIVGVIMILIGVYGMAPVGEQIIPCEKNPSCHLTDLEKEKHIEEGCTTFDTETPQPYNPPPKKLPNMKSLLDQSSTDIKSMSQDKMIQKLRRRYPQ